MDIQARIDAGKIPFICRVCNKVFWMVEIPLGNSWRRDDDYKSYEVPEHIKVAIKLQEDKYSYEDSWKFCWDCKCARIIAAQDKAIEISRANRKDGDIPIYFS